ncbi:MAG: hypothetical protein DWQ51_03480 [Microcystis wesenbergii TW10]|uniref:Uncharacterized protein n=1 Tax=Microcystis wesenbergii TW10 TaxID=2060474 RepID=A0A3E0MC91_9CHRO|nr:MAG: hypothetical protein DWQ51_03480 [Microcystis wesenbergii TW10]
MIIRIKSLVILKKKQLKIMLVDVLAKSVISYQLSVIRCEFSVNSMKWQVGSFLFTDYRLLFTSH